MKLDLKKIDKYAYYNGTSFNYSDSEKFSIYTRIAKATHFYCAISGISFKLYQVKSNGLWRIEKRNGFRTSYYNYKTKRTNRVNKNMDIRKYDADIFTAAEHFLTLVEKL